MANIFTQTDTNTAPGTGNITPEQLRVNVLTKEQANNFNTYRTKNDMYAPTETTDINGEKKTYTHIIKKSLFSDDFGISSNLEYQERTNAPLLDAPEIRKRMHARDACTVKDLVEMSGKYGRVVYDYSDFMYCKHLGKTSNNYLITLRRFAFPCGDHISVYNTESDTEKDMQGHRPDVGRLVTWLGTPENDFSNFFKYTLKIPYEKLEAKMDDVDGDGEGGGVLGALMNMSNPKYKQQVLDGDYGQSSFKLTNSLLGKVPGGGALSSLMGEPRGGGIGLETFHDQTKTYGPADALTYTHKRKGAAEGGGLEFEQTFSITFDYELRSYDGVNGRAAMLDLLGNILTVTYNNATFWGGGYRMTGASQSNVFANLPLFKLKSSDMTFGGLCGAFTDSLQQVGAGFNNGQKIQSPGDVLNAIKNIGSSLGNLFVSGVINKLGRPKKIAVSSLLSDAPVGPWHLMIGNPKHPILSIGNLIMDGAEIEHYGRLGLDGFPTGLKVKVTLKHAKPRDNQLIEQMYTGGDFRIYQPLVGSTREMYETAANVNTTKKETQNTENSNDKNKSTTPSDKVEGAKSSANASKKQTKPNSNSTSEQTNVSTSTETAIENADLTRYLLKKAGMKDMTTLERNTQEIYKGSEIMQKKKK